MKQARPYPKATITKKAARALAQGYLWVFEGEVESIAPAAGGRPVQNGAIVDLFEENGTWQGAGLLSEESKIRVRVLSKNANDRFDEGFWRRRILWAWEHRKAVMGARSLPGAEPDTNCCRILFSEADGVPGLIVDRYEDVLVAQVGTYGMELRKEMLFPLILDVLRSDGQKIRGIYERADSPARRLEGLDLHKGWWKEPGVPTPDNARVMAQENGLLFDLDIENSQKTGFFLDQKYNRRAVRELAKGRRVLDCFSHVGPFGFNAAAGGAEFVRCVDISDTAIALAQENAKLNHLDDRMDFTCANVVEYLPELVKSKAAPQGRGRSFRPHHLGSSRLHEEPLCRGSCEEGLPRDQRVGHAPSSPRRIPRDVLLLEVHDNKAARGSDCRGGTQRKCAAQADRAQAAGSGPSYSLGDA
ncbi:MAG: SAM-dependent methyltransferase [Atopobium sp.]